MGGQDLFRAWETSQGISCLVQLAYNLIMIQYNNENNIIIIITIKIWYNDNDNNNDMKTYLLNTAWLSAKAKNDEN